MVLTIHPWGVIWVQSNRPQAGHLSEKKYDLAVQYEDVHDLMDHFILHKAIGVVGRWFRV